MVIVSSVDTLIIYVSGFAWGRECILGRLINLTIRINPRSYHKFVQHRLGELDDLTGASLWR